jgi:AmmeMemoRadiSam system protein A
MILNKNEKEILLKLSRNSLEHMFKFGKELDPETIKLSEKFREKKATFVTLTKYGMLRGCIGKLKPTCELYKDIIENTYSAAFSDPRFPQLSKEECKDIKIEISILDTPQRLEYKTPDELTKKLDKVILQSGFYSATFLPQVWEELKTPDEFLSHLCQKAGLENTAWKDKNIEIYIYNVLKFKES